MAKDPAFLFYPGDFSTGTQFFTDEQVGKYMRLLMAQHQHGHLPENHMIFICKSYDKDVFSKFTKDKDGLWYNERLQIEIEKRKNYVASRSKNKEGKTKTKIISNSYDSHMENENRNEIEDVINNALDEISLNEIQSTFPKHDFPNELKIFKLKVRGSPQKYLHRDSGSIRQAFIYQLSNSKSNGNGSKDKGTPRRADATIESGREFGKL